MADVIQIAREMSALARQFYIAFREAMVTRASPARARDILVRMNTLVTRMAAIAHGGSDDLSVLLRATVAEAHELSRVTSEYEFLLARNDDEAMRRFIAREMAMVERELAPENDIDDDTSGSPPRITAMIGDDAPHAYLAHAKRRDPVTA